MAATAFAGVRAAVSALRAAMGRRGRAVADGGVGPSPAGAAEPSTGGGLTTRNLIRMAQSARRARTIGTGDG